MPAKYLPHFVKFYKAHKRLPTYRELMQAAKLKSTNAVHKIVAKLAEEGYLSRDANGKIAPGRRFLQLPLLGEVTAGFPSPAEEELVDTMSLEEYLINRKEATYLLKVQGDSMIDAGIMPGDILLVERGREAKENDIVVAEVDHQWTLKYFRRKGQQVTLVPANKKYKTIYPREELKIAAIVVAAVRKYKN
jgi:SOS regulatory protein LexA